MTSATDASLMRLLAAQLPDPIEVYRINANLETSRLYGPLERELVTRRPSVAADGDAIDTMSYPSAG